MLARRSLILLASLPFAAGIALGFSIDRIDAALKASKIFKDVPESHFAHQAISEMYALGVIKGMDATTFNPDGNVTRAQLAVMFKRFRDSLGEEAIVIDESTTAASSSSRSSRAKSSSSKSSSSTASSVNTTTNGTFDMAVETISIPETAKKVQFTVRRKGGNGTASVKYQTSDVSTKEGDDYSPNGGTLSFADGETSKIVTVSLIDDKVGEGSEQFKITLSDATAQMGIGTPGTVLITLLDDEAPGSTSSGTASSAATSTAPAVAGAGSMEFSATAYATIENAANITVTVLRTGGSNGAVKVNYATSDGTAVSGKDYAAAAGTLEFAAGETSKTFTVSVNDNQEIDGNRKVNLTLSAPQGGAGLGVQKTSTFIINDNDMGATNGNGVIQMPQTSYQGKGGTSVLVTVSRLSGTAGTVTVNYGTSDSSAANGKDYTTTAGTLTFLQGEMSKTIAVPILSGAKSEGKINFSISNPTGGATLGSEGTLAVITIQ